MAGRVYRTAIEIGASISKAFKGEALAAASALGKLASSTKALQSAQKSAAAYAKLDEAVKGSKARYDQAAAALQRLRDAEKAAGQATKESTAWIKAGEKEVAKAAKEFDRATKAAERNGKALRELGVDTKNLANEQRKLAAASQFASARERIFGKKKDTDPVPLAQKAREQIGGLAREAAAVAAIAGSAGVALAGLVGKTIEHADEIGDTAEKLGIGTKALQELRYGAKLTGAETEDLDKALAKLSVNIGRFKNAKASKGGSAAMSIPGLQMLGDGAGPKEGSAGETDPFKRIGLNAKELAKLQPEQQLRKIAAGLATLKTHADKAAVVQAALGKSGLALLPFLEKGPAGIDKLAAAANKYGGVLSDAAIEAAGKADDAMKEATAAVTGLGATLGSTFLPVATNALQKFTEWVLANREQIQAWAENAAKWIEGKAIPAIVKVASEATRLATKVASLVSWGAQLVGGFDNLAIAVGALRLAPLALTLGKIGVSGVQAGIAIAKFAAASSTSMAPILAMGAPLLAIAAAAGAVAIAISRISDAVKELGGAGAVWQDVKDFVARGGMDHVTRTGSGNRAGFEAMQAENARNLELARARAIPSGSGVLAMPSTAPAGGGTFQYAPVINVGEGSRAGVAQQIDAGNERAKAAALEAWDQREAQRRRLSFAE